MGYGRDRKGLEGSEERAGKKTELDLEGVFQEAEVYVSGRPAG